MKRDEWKTIVVDNAIGIGVYREEFEPVIDSLSIILEQRDKTMEDYIRTGEHPVISHTNKGGATNIVKNPLLCLWSELNKDALAYWRDLGLTPSGLKKLNENAVVVKTEEQSTLSKILESIKE